MTHLAFYCGSGTWRDAVIRQVTGSRFSHVELVGPNGQCISASKRDGAKVRTKRIHMKTGHWCLVYVPVCPATSWARACEHLGKPYDALGAVLSGGLGVPFHMPRGWYCNELMAYALDLPEPWPAHPGALFDVLTN